MSSTSKEIIFLGTGSSLGSPVIGFNHPVCYSKDSKDRRFRSAILIKKNKKTLLIDCGPDFRIQMLRAGCTQLHGILFTHDHADHTAGLDDIRPFNFLMKKALPIYAEKRVIKALKNRFNYCFASSHYPSAPELAPYIIDESPLFIEGIKIIPIRVIHGDLPILGYRIDDFAYITDANYISENSLEKLKNLKTLVINALRKNVSHHSQYILPEALEVVKKLQPEKAYITHISPTMGFHQQVEEELPNGVSLAYDGLQLFL